MEFLLLTIQRLLHHSSTFCPSDQVIYIQWSTSSPMATSNLKGTLTFLSTNGQEFLALMSHWKELCKERLIKFLGKRNVDQIGSDYSIVRGHHDTITIWCLVRNLSNPIMSFRYTFVLYLKSTSRVEDFYDSAAQEESVSRTERFRSRAVREQSGLKIEQKCGSVYIVTWVYIMIPDQQPRMMQEGVAATQTGRYQRTRHVNLRQHNTGVRAPVPLWGCVVMG